MHRFSPRSDQYRITSKHDKLYHPAAASMLLLMAESHCIEAKASKTKTTCQKSEKSELPTVNIAKELAKVAEASHDTIQKSRLHTPPQDHILKTGYNTGRSSPELLTGY